MVDIEIYDLDFAGDQVVVANHRISTGAYDLVVVAIGRNRAVDREACELQAAAVYYLE